MLCMFCDIPCMQMCVFTNGAGAGGGELSLTLMFRTDNCIFAFEMQ